MPEAPTPLTAYQQTYHWRVSQDPLQSFIVNSVSEVSTSLWTATSLNNQAECVEQELCTLGSRVVQDRVEGFES
jgi:hypothetical protein